MSTNVAVLKLSRQIHLYFGLLISPALLFFAFTGAMQTLSLHEAAGTSYRPPAWLAVWGQIHKKQTWMLPVRHSGAREEHAGNPAAPGGGASHPESGAPSAGDAPRPEGEHRSHGGGGGAALPTLGAATPSGPPQQPVTLRAKQKQHLPLKLFYLLVGLGLFTNTVTGVYMAYKYHRNKLLVTGILVAGIVIPLALLPF